MSVNVNKEEQAYYFVPVNMPGEKEHHKLAGWWAVYLQELMSFHKFELAQHYLSIAKKLGCLDTINEAATKHAELCNKYKHLTGVIKRTKSGTFQKVVETHKGGVVREGAYMKDQPYFYEQRA